MRDSITISLQMAASVAIMALTNGYGSSVMMMYGPAKVGWFCCAPTRCALRACVRLHPFILSHNGQVKPERRELAGIIMSCFLQVGSATSVHISPLVVSG